MGLQVRDFFALAVMACLGASAYAADSADYTKGMELVSKKSYKEAIQFFDKALQQDAKHSEARTERALCNFYLGNYKDVLSDCKEVIAHDAAHSVTKRQAYMMSAGAHNALGEYNEAIQDCEKSISLNPKASIAYSDRAFAYQQLKKYDEALKDCNEAIKLDPKHASNYAMRAAIYETLARADRGKLHELRAARRPGEKPWQALLEKVGQKTATGEKK